jgi:uncharacterized LabA/DUF88 family protein
MPDSPDSTPSRRVVAYVDGFNLYFGLRASGMQKYLWLDLPSLAGSLLKEDQALRVTKYFTARITAPEAKRIRQSTYIEALSTHAGTALSIYYGRYQTQNLTCRFCSAVQAIPSEKKTDVNIAVEMMVDAFGDSFDSALLVTADSDLVPAVRSIRKLFPDKRIVVAFPPSRFSRELQREAHASFVIGRAKLASAQLPDCVVKPNGTVLRRPESWM